ncbi:noncanonical pyrimidine nucleotidase, YjjG family [Flavobacterium alkalisoli]|uniref:Noncanonical pyrimidine nucleotidase, YjjG family n=1 Tax=Flavobacterium alkalisoli TaxID=2602769 RepID=A0A5B9FUS0_9FLAO|nr:YjjG family noncanonical pyrimidine nucleotidase [Flavobacterium alkalisoli]QEE49388.1 noncanonical pyrimidine nucleotidase, YjjG family [Flavobacterium alkalisoli]
MKLKEKKAVFFDLDHTLWDFEKNSALTFQVILQKHNVEVDIELFIENYIPINLKYWKMYRDGHISQQELRYNRLKEAFDTVGCDVNDVTIDKLWEDYIALLPTYNHLYEGTVEILEYLRPNYSLHIITNGVQEIAKLKNADIYHYFDTITNSEQAGCKKPDAKIFEYALKIANVEKNTGVMIGDCIEADVQGALDCGLDAIYFNENKLAVKEGIPQVHHLLELKNFL